MWDDQLALHKAEIMRILCEGSLGKTAVILTRQLPIFSLYWRICVILK